MTTIKTSLTWEAVESVTPYTTHRMRVGSGWVVRVAESTTFNNFQLIYIPDPEGKWIATDTDDA